MVKRLLLTINSVSPLEKKKKNLHLDFFQILFLIYNKNINIKKNIDTIYIKKTRKNNISSQFQTFLIYILKITHA